MGGGHSKEEDAAVSRGAGYSKSALATLGINFGVASTIWEMCKSVPTAENTPFSHVYINDRIAKEFGGEDNLSEWAKALNAEMAVATVLAVKELKLAKSRGVQCLAWPNVMACLNNCDYIVKDESSSKRINKLLPFDDVTWWPQGHGTNELRVRTILTWFKQLFNEEEEQSVLDNSIIVENGTLDRLAGIAAEYGAALNKGWVLAVDSNKEKVMEIGVLRFPRKGNARFKLYRMVIFAFFKSSRILIRTHNQAGFELEYDSVEFKANTAAIDANFAQKAKDKLSDPETFNW